MQYPQTKLLKTGSAIRLPFDQFESMDLSLGLPVTVRGLKSAIDRVVIAINTRGQTPQLRNAALLRFFEPARQNGNLPLCNHSTKILCQMIGSSQLFIFDAQRLQLPPDLSPLELARVTDKEPGGLVGR